VHFYQYAGVGSIPRSRSSAGEITEAREPKSIHQPVSCNLADATEIADDPDSGGLELALEKAGLLQG